MRVGRSGAIAIAASLMLAVIATFATGAARAQQVAVPDALEPWVDWVAAERPGILCTHRLMQDAGPDCAWPGVLRIELTAGGGAFEQGWEIERRTLVPLPGSAAHWPRAVTVDGRPAPVTARDGVPMVSLEPGSRRVAGLLAWDARPSRLPVPPQTALVALAVDGVEQPTPARDSQGRLELDADPQAASDRADRLELSVFRRLVDSVPMLVHTYIALDVSGVERELILPRAFLPDAEPLAIRSDVNARLLADGRIQLQVRPGRHYLELTSRLGSRVVSVRRGGVELPLPPREVWSFEPRSALRDVRPEGLPPVDPRQTRMPEQWQNLAAFVATPDAELKLVEQPRTSEVRPPDQLSLVRDLWLDFGGGGFTLQDRIDGVSHGDRRLEAAAPITLGRVSVNGEPRFITRIDEGDAHGIEFRPGRYRVVADARLESLPETLPVAGWNRDLDSVSATLHLPPGWRLAAATGVERVEGSWLDRWSMLDMFLVLVVAIASFRMWGWWAGLVALFGLALAWHESGAPQYAWLPVLAFTALHGSLADGRLKDWMNTGRWLALVGLVVVAAPYLVQTARTIAYPQLERPGVTVRDGAETLARAPAMAEPVAVQALEYSVREKMMVVDAAPSPAPPPARPDREIGTALIQTGPGVPNWRWNRVALAWSGPVTMSRSYSLWLLPPPANRALDLARLLLVIALVAVMVLNRSRDPGPPVLGPSSSVAAGLLAAALALFGVEESRAQAFPAPELLEELGTRLEQPPDCLPHCAAVAAAGLSVADGVLEMVLEIDAVARIGVPLPTAVGWSPSTLSVDGAPAPLLGAAERAPLAPLEAGSHRLVMRGALGAAREIQLTFPLRPMRVRVEAPGWQHAGMERDGGGDRQLRLWRTDPIAATAAGDTAEPAAGLVIPFFEVHRTLLLGLDARVAGEVVRLSDAATPLAVDIPLLPGESPLDAAEVVPGSVRAVFAAGQERFSWESIIALENPLRLTAPEGNRVEVWRLDADTRWHVAHEGIAPIRVGGEQGPVTEWRPRPGDALELTMLKPGGVPGNTLTVDRSRLEISPGPLVSRVFLEVFLRSSQGGVHVLRLPADAEVQHFRLDGQPQPIERGLVELPVSLAPGEQRVEIEWQQPLPMVADYRTPLVDLNMPSVNTTLTVNPAADRWLVWLAGPSLGPAVLYWGLVGFLLLASIALSRVPMLPLAWWQWFLLGIGMSHGGIWYIGVLVAWFALLALRRRVDETTPKGRFNLLQLAIAVVTLVMLSGLVQAVQGGLLGDPDMQIAGNGSDASRLSWYQDRTDSALPQAMVVSVPLFAYRMAMLAWSLWLAVSLVRWLRWGWQGFSTGGVWRPIRWRLRRSAATDAADGE